MSRRSGCDKSLCRLARGPKPGLGHEFVFNELAGTRVGNTEERADKAAVVGEDVGLEAEGTHGP